MCDVCVCDVLCCVHFIRGMRTLIYGFLRIGPSECVVELMDVVWRRSDSDVWFDLELLFSMSAGSVPHCC